MDGATPSTTSRTRWSTSGGRPRSRGPGPGSRRSGCRRTLLPWSELERAGLAGVDGIPVGLGERDLRPIGLDLLGDDTHVLAVGDQGSGKTSFLRAVVRGSVDRHGDDELVFAVVDPRRSLLGGPGRPPRRLRAHLPGRRWARPVAGRGAAPAAARRRAHPGRAARPELVVGIEIVVLVDDLELLRRRRPAGAAAALPAAGPGPRPARGRGPAQRRHRPGAVRALPAAAWELGATGLVRAGTGRRGSCGRACSSSLPTGRGTSPAGAGARPSCRSPTCPPTPDRKDVRHAPGALRRGRGPAAGGRRAPRPPGAGGSPGHVRRPDPPGRRLGARRPPRRPGDRAGPAPAGRRRRGPVGPHPPGRRRPGPGGRPWARAPSSTASCSTSAGTGTATSLPTRRTSPRRPPAARTAAWVLDRGRHPAVPPPRPPSGWGWPGRCWCGASARRRPRRRSSSWSRCWSGGRGRPGPVTT